MTDVNKSDENVFEVAEFDAQDVSAEDTPFVPKVEKEVEFIIRGLRKISSGFVDIVCGVERIVRAILCVVKKIF